VPAKSRLPLALLLKPLLVLRLQHPEAHVVASLSVLTQNALPPRSSSERSGAGALDWSCERRCWSSLVRSWTSVRDRRMSTCGQSRCTWTSRRYVESSASTGGPPVTCSRHHDYNAQLAPRYQGAQRRRVLLGGGWWLVPTSIGLISRSGRS